MGGHTWTIKFYLGGWGSVRSQIVHTFPDGRRNTVHGNNEWNNGDFNYIRMRGQACVTTHFGLKLCYASKKWYTQVYVPRCYQNMGIIGACGNFNGNQWDDGAVPGSSPIRLRRAIEPEQPEIVKRDADRDPSKIVKKAFSPESPKETCNQDYDTVSAACNKVASENSFAVCNGDVDATSAWIETCIFDACSENETDFCADYKTYMAGCADDNLGNIIKGDDYCDWLTKQDVSLNVAKIAIGKDVLMNATISKHVVHVPQYQKIALLRPKWSPCVFATMVSL